jgi:hypothetical protein
MDAQIESKEEHSINKDDNKGIAIEKNGVLLVYQVLMMAQEGMEDIEHVLEHIVEIKIGLTWD